MRRFPSLVKRLQATKTLWAFERLVKLGCLPDALAECIQEQERTPSESELRKKRDRLQQSELSAIAREFERLADRCDNYFSVADLEHLDSVVDISSAIWLRNEAARFQAEAARRDPRKRRSSTRAEAVLLQTMIETKAITGKYCEDLLVEILKHAPRHQGTTPESLKRWRARELLFWKDRMPASAGLGNRSIPRLIGAAHTPDDEE